MVALLALGGCAIQTEQQINAEMARHIGQSETDLVREMGVPTRSYDSAGHRFLAYYKGEQEVDNFGGGFYGTGFSGWGGWGWGGGFYGGAFDGPSRITTHGCDTTFEVSDGRVLGFKRHGNAC